MWPYAGDPSVLWPREGDEVYLTGSSLHRLGQNSAVEYWEAKDKGNVRKIHVEKIGTTFWVMRAQATEHETPAHATLSESLAQGLVECMLLGGRDLDVALQRAGVALQGRVDLAALDNLFHLHCVVMQGKLLETYFRRCYARDLNQGRRICTCPTFVQRGDCQHVQYVAALQGEIDLEKAPERKKPGRKRLPAFGGGQPAKRRRSGRSQTPAR